jgi:hypothetical protein
LGCPRNSQEAAIIDGVLIENGFLSHNPTAGNWELAVPTPETPSEVLREVLRHLGTRGQGLGDKPFLKLYEKLIEPPYGVPNGTIPLYVALAFRAEPARIGIYYKRYNNWERVESKIAEAIVGMARFPARYQTRYSKLSPKQRWVFRVVGPDEGVSFPETGMSADKAEALCEKLASVLRDFARKLPEVVVTLPELSEPQRDLLKILRGGVPPQLTLLADHLMRMVQEDPQARQELEDAGNNRMTFPATVRLWRDFRACLGKQIEGFRAPVRRQLQEVAKDRRGVVEVLRKVEAIAGPNNSVLGPIAERLASSEGKAELIEEVVAAVSNKEPRQLNQEDYGRASGVLEVIQSLAPPQGRTTLVLPDGSRRDLPAFTHEEASAQVREAVQGWQAAYSLSAEQIAALLLEAIYSQSPAYLSAPPGDDEQPPGGATRGI